jgi:hypothetical protein
MISNTGPSQEEQRTDGNNEGQLKVGPIFREAATTGESRTFIYFYIVENGGENNKSIKSLHFTCR